MFPAKPLAYRVDMMSDAAKSKWPKAQDWGMSEDDYVKYYKLDTQQKKKAEILADYFWRIIKGK